ncbi:uncharacterized protein C9orf43 homolog isoform X1 [Marmota flaviventris]|uniref:uncharacterized protein C9orf43 homolog isoform X1 n=1 Tax=Marmota flaviventris TaxID=93162 RepID=UPI000FFFB8CF|nr:uncharacterized protein C9orf43 homolog [Marmota flaviventris]
MDWPDESQWDETTCNMAICQHPQCWAALRRIERGHPRILGSPCKTFLNIEEKLPVLTIVNISDSCLQAKRCAHQELSKFTFTKAHPLLSQCSKIDAKFQGRHRKGLPDKRLISSAKRSSKLPVLNLNETKLPCPEGVRNMVVIWIPEPEKNVSLAKKTHTFPSQDGKEERKNSAVENKPPLDHSERKHTEMQLRFPDVIVPPPSPVHSFESIPGWSKFAMLPEDLLKDLLSDGGKTMPCPEMKIQLAMMKKKLPLEKNRPERALSSKMFLTIHRLTLQTPTLRYSEHLKKLHCNLQGEDYRKQQQHHQQQKKKKKKKKRKVKTPTKKKEATEKATSDPGSQTTAQKHSISIDLNRLHGPEISEAEATNKDVSAPEEAVLEGPVASGQNISGQMTGESWNPEFKLLRILQPTDDENEKNQPSGAQSQKSLQT